MSDPRSNRLGLRPGRAINRNPLNTRPRSGVKSSEMLILLMMRRSIFAGLLIVLTVGAVSARGVGPTPEGIDYFEKNVRPILVDTCYKCHSAQSEKLKGGLYVDSPYGLRKGGKTGPAIVPGEPEKSLLIKAVRYVDEDMQMPPKEQLSKGQVAALETWVKMGVPDPRTDPATAATAAAAPAPTTLSLAESKNFWSFKRPVMPSVPVVKGGDWAKSAEDAIILDKLAASGMQPAAAADKRTLIRRATFYLTGRPPTGAASSAFWAGYFAKSVGKVFGLLVG